MRILLVEVAPLLADLIQRALQSRGDFEIFVEGAQPTDAIVADFIILGPRTPSEAARLIRQRFPGTRILELASDLSLLHGPGGGEECDLTLETLLENLLN